MENKSRIVFSKFEQKWAFIIFDRVLTMTITHRLVLMATFSNDTFYNLKQCPEESDAGWLDHVSATLAVC